MPAKRPSSSPVKRRPKGRKRFTLAEASRTLPLVSRVVRDIVRDHELARETHVQLEAKPAAHVRADLERDLERRLTRLQELVEELGAIGCELKDFRLGLVDFIGRHQGRDVCLCWKLGEETIAHWHETNAGFTARQAIETLEEG